MNTGPVSVNPPAAGDRRVSQSVFRRLSMSIGNSRKSSMFPIPNQPRPNTYRMEPDHEYRFRPYKLQSKVLEVLIEQMKDKSYDPSTINDLIKDVSRSVSQLVRNFQLPRYKLVVHTMIVQKFNQALRSGSRCLWDQKQIICYRFIMKQKIWLLLLLYMPSILNKSFIMDSFLYNNLVKRIFL